MTTLVTVFKSTDSGAPTLSGTVGDLTSVLSHCLIIGKVFRTADDAAFTDNTTEARTSISGETPFTLFPTPGTADRTYIGHSSKFTSLTIGLGTAGSAGITYVWEYWNGSAWTTLTVTDGTSGFVQNGTITWTSPGSWATTSVNSVTMYWVRVRFTGSAPGTNPTVKYISYLGWLEVQSGSSQRDYQQGSGSNGYILSVNDNAVGTGGAKEARIKGFESSSGLGTGLRQFPTTSQGVTYNTGYNIVRKSNTADATTRTWTLIGDTRTFYLFILTGDQTGIYGSFSFGDIYSFITSDIGRCYLMGRTGENSTSMAYNVDNLSALQPIGTVSDSFAGGIGTPCVLNRDHQGTFAPISFGRFGALEYCTSSIASSQFTLIGNVAYKNPADSLIYLSPVWVHTIAGGSVIRGRMRGFWHFCHTIGNCSDGDTITGSGDLAGKTFLIIKFGASNTGTGNQVSAYCMETSDTWESN